EHTARGDKRDAVDTLLSVLPTGNKQQDAKLNSAINHLTKSLDPKLWIDDSHLTMGGSAVFREEKLAVDSLTAIPSPSAAVSDAIDSAIESLIAADRALAMTAIDEAALVGGHAQKLAQAEAEMEKAARELEKNHPSQAIIHYGNAW